MRYVLIDTNCWIDLLANESAGKSLRSIEQFVNENKIELLVPERLKEEWIRNKNRHFNELKESINVGIRGFESITQKRLKHELKRRQEKAQRIDFLLENGKNCPANKSVHAEVGDRKSKSLPPFHINKNSDGDAYIYFSATTFVKSKKLKEVLFITHDKKAFSHEGEEKELHPGLYVNGVDIKYFYGIEIGTYKLGEILGIKDEAREENADSDPIFYFFDDDKQISLPEKIYKVLDVYYDQLPFIPSHLLVKIFPFKILNSRTNYTYHSSFRINTNNQQLAEFFQSIKIGENNQINFIKPELVKHLTAPKQKVHTILYRLNQNLIFDISAISSDIDIDIRLKIEKEKPSIQDRVNNFDFLGAFRLLKSKSQKDVRETLQQAYVHFQFGDFDLAIQLFDRVYEKSKSNRKPILAFIALHNMKRVKNFINAYYASNDSKTFDIIKKIDRLTIKKYRVTYEQEPAFVQDCIAWIADNDFYQEAFINLSETVEKIKDHYYAQLGGGFSSNSNYRNIISHYLEVDQLLEQNCIIFNTYSNFEEITEKLAEGLLMMHIFNNKQPGRVDSLDHILLQKIIMYAKRETIVKYYHRLNIKGIISEESNDKKSIVKTAEKFFGDYTNLRDLLKKNEEKNPYFFWEKYYKVAGNLLLIVTISKSTVDLTNLTRKLIDVLTDDIISRRMETAHIADFIREKGKYIQVDVLKKFLLLAIDNNRLHHSSIFHALNKQMILNHKGLCITNKSAFNKIEQYFFQECPKCNSFHEPNLLREAYVLLHEPFKKQLHNKIIQKLSQKFNKDLYYIFAIYELIDYKLFFHEFLESAPPLKNDKPRYSSFGDPDANYYGLNEVINLAFKLKIDTRETLFQRYKGISSYYDWLLDIDGFDYTHFNPEWILAYKTEVYFRKIFSSPKVIEHLSNYLKKSKHPVLSELMIKYGF